VGSTVVGHTTFPTTAKLGYKIIKNCHVIAQKENVQTRFAQIAGRQIKELKRTLLPEVLTQCQEVLKMYADVLTCYRAFRMAQNYYRGRNSPKIDALSACTAWNFEKFMKKPAQKSKHVFLYLFCYLFSMPKTKQITYS
jgi:hypothetical protein